MDDSKSLLTKNHLIGPSSRLPVLLLQLVTVDVHSGLDAGVPHLILHILEVFALVDLDAFDLVIRNLYATWPKVGPFGVRLPLG